MSKNDRSRSPLIRPSRNSSRGRAKPNLLPKALAFAVASCFAADLAIANPNGMSVVNGQVTLNRNGNILTLTNTPGAIVNWQSFSISANEATRFIQQSAASSVLNRVIGVDPSVILGALQSNGRVFLINPSGILFGAGAQIDVAGLVASTLNLSNADFLAGRLRFTETPGAGSLVNNGAITTPTGGQVFLIAPNVQNTGIITSPQGQVILAAGRSVELVDAATPNLRIEISAPDTEAVNVGQIIANSGKIGIYSGLIRNSGVVRADGVVQGANGEILLKATNTATLESGGVLSASGAGNGIGGGNIAVEARTITNAGQVLANAADNAGAGNISMIAQDMLTLEGTSRVAATGANVNSSGGTVYLYSYGDATANAGQLIDLSGGGISGNGGNGEFSAAHSAAFSGSVIGTAAPGYVGGSFIIDPPDGTIGPATIGANTTTFATNNITIAGDVTVNSGFSLTLLADHNSGTPGDWEDGVGRIINAGLNGAFTITATDNTNSLTLMAAGGGIGTDLEPVRTNMRGGSLSVFTNNPGQVGAANSFITNAASIVNIARFDDGGNGNSFRIVSGGNITQTGIITAGGFAAVVTGSNNTVNLPLDNEVGIVAGSASGGAFSAAFAFNNAQPLTIGSVLGENGISVDGQTAAVVNVTTSAGDLTVSNPVVASSVEGVALITLASAGVNTVDAAVTANGNGIATVTLTSGTSMAINAPVTGNSVNGDATVTLTAGTDLSVTAGGPVSANADANASVTLQTDSGSLTINDTVEAIADLGNAATVLAATGGDLTGSGFINATANAGGNASVQLTTLGGGAIAMTNTIEAQASSGLASVNLDSSGALAVADVNANSVFGDASVTLTSAAGMQVNGPVNADGGEGATITFTSNSGGLTINSTVNANGNNTNATILITANGGGAITTFDTITANANVDALITLVTNGGGAINLNGGDTINAFGNNATINVTTTGGGAINVNSPLDAEANNNATINVSSSGALTASAGVDASSSNGDASITLTSAAAMFVNGAVNADGGEGAATVVFTANSGGLTINNTVDAFSNGSDATILITANNGGVMEMNNTITADANFNALVTLETNGGGAINLNAAETINAFGSNGNATVNVTANGGGSIFVGTPINADANINAAVNLSGGSIVLGNNVNADGGEGASISVSALSGAITRTGGVLSAFGSFSSVVDLNATNGIGTFASPIQLELGGNSLVSAVNTTSGDIVLSQTGLMITGEISNSAPGGAVDLTAVDNHLVTTDTISSAGAINLRSTLTDGIININQAVEGAGIVTLISDNMDILAPVSSGANVINVRTFTAARPISLGTIIPVGGALELSQGEINNLSSGNGVFVGDQVARNNAITFVGPLNVTGTLQLFGSSVSQDLTPGVAPYRGGLVVGVGPGNVTLTEPTNAITSFATSGTLAGALNLVTTSDIGFGPVDATGHPVTVSSGAGINFLGLVQASDVNMTGGGAIGLGPVTATGTVTVNSGAGVNFLGSVQGGTVNVTSGGAITDGNVTGADVIASSVTLTAANGIGTLANPLETQVNSPLSVTSTGGDIGVINLGNVNLALSLTGGGNISFTDIGNLVLDSLAFTGVTAVLEATGLMSLGSNIAVSASDGLALIGDSGLSVQRSISVTGGDLILSGGPSNLAITAPSGGLTISARNVDLIANNISVIGVDGGASGATTIQAAQNMALTASNQVNIRGGAVSSSPVEISNLSGGFSVITGGDVNLLGGAGASSHTLFFGSPDVDMIVGGVIHLDNGPGAGSSSKIASASGNTIRIFFPNCAEVDGCFFVNGVAGLVFDPVSGSGFIAGGAPAILGENAIIEFGIPNPEVITEVPETVQATLSFITGEINNSTNTTLGSEREDDQTAKKEETTTGPGVCS